MKHDLKPGDRIRVRGYGRYDGSCVAPYLQESDGPFTISKILSDLLCFERNGSEISIDRANVRAVIVPKKKREKLACWIQADEHNIIRTLGTVKPIDTPARWRNVRMVEADDQSDGSTIGFYGEFRK